MTQPNDRSRRLRHTLTNFEKIGADVDTAFARAEDALTQLEDREHRQALRQGTGEHPIMQGRV